MEYRYLTTSLEGFVQQLACNILPHGYWFYVRGSIPDGKDPLSIDAKLLDRYGLQSLVSSGREESCRDWQTSIIYVSVALVHLRNTRQASIL